MQDDARTGTGPTALRIALGGQLRRRREAAAVTREDAGEAIRASAAKISRLELGRVGFKERDFVDLLPGWAETYIGLEQTASLIRSYEVQFVPGLLQTADDAREVTRLGHDDARAVDRRVELRIRRQSVLSDPHGPTPRTVVDEAALVEQYAQVMDRLCAQIEPLDRTAAILGKIRAEL